VCTYVFLLWQETFDKILVNNPYQRMRCYSNDPVQWNCRVPIDEYVVDMGQSLSARVAADGEEQQSSQIFRLCECGGARPLNPLTCGFRLLHNSWLAVTPLHVTGSSSICLHARVCWSEFEVLGMHWLAANNWPCSIICQRKFVYGEIKTCSTRYN
jgi:hypothetical protein